MKRCNIPAKRIIVMVNTACVDRRRPVLERIECVVAATTHEWNLIRFLSPLLRRSRIAIDEIIVGENLIWANTDQLWSRKRIAGCIKDSGRVADTLQCQNINL